MAVKAVRSRRHENASGLASRPPLAPLPPLTQGAAPIAQALKESISKSLVSTADGSDGAAGCALSSEPSTVGSTLIGVAQAYETAGEHGRAAEMHIKARQVRLAARQRERARDAPLP